MLNKLLERQIMKHLGGMENIPESCITLFEAISQSYEHYEKDRSMLERSIGISSDEMIRLNQQLKVESNALKRTNAELSSLFQNIEEVFFSIDIKRHLITQMSPACEKLYGYTPQEFMNNLNLWMETIHPSDLHLIQNHLKDFSLGKPVSYQYRIIHKNQSIRWIESKVIPTLDESGQLIRLDGFNLDITEKKVVEESLSRSEANLRSIFDNTEIGYMLLDSNMKVISFNKQLELFTLQDLHHQVVEGDYCIQYFPHLRQPIVKQMMEKVLKGQNISYEINYPKDDGSIRWYSIHLFGVATQDTKIFSLVMSLEDITNMKLATDEIRVSNERYEFATKATNDVIWDWDIVNNSVYRSENYRHLFGHPLLAKGAYPDQFVSHIHREDRVRLLESIDKAILSAESGVWEEEYRYYRANGETAYVQDRGYIILDETGKSIRMVGAMRDITHQKKLELEREEITRDLIQRNKDLEQFAFIISHNLGAPVANILGLLNVLNQMEHLSPADNTTCWKGLFESVNCLNEIIVDLNHILQVRREIKEDKKLVIFTALVEGIKSSLSSMLEKEEVQIDIDFEAFDKIYTLKTYMHSIFYNLIFNSIKFRSPNRKPRLQISTFWSGKKAYLKFSDNGLGIDLANQGEKVFGLYKCFHPHIQGKGMGLYIVKTQVEILGGHISIGSEIDKGTEFLIELNIKPEEIPNQFKNGGLLI
jgi:PAS domain S-box-containing protein